VLASIIRHSKGNRLFHPARRALRKTQHAGGAF